jgi:hypothetical protein
LDLSTSVATTVAQWSTVTDGYTVIAEFQPAPTVVASEYSISYNSDDTHHANVDVPSTSNPTTTQPFSDAFKADKLSSLGYQVCARNLANFSNLTGIYPPSYCDMAKAPKMPTDPTIRDKSSYIPISSGSQRTSTRWDYSPAAAPPGYQLPLYAQDKPSGYEPTAAAAPGSGRHHFISDKHKAYLLYKQGLPVTSNTLANFANLAQLYPELNSTHGGTKHGTTIAVQWGTDRPQSSATGSSTAGGAQVGFLPAGVPEVPPEHISQETWNRDPQGPQFVPSTYYACDARARKTHGQLAHQGKLPYPSCWTGNNYNICREVDLDSRDLNPDSENFGSEYRLLYVHSSGADPVAEVLQTAYLQGALCAASIYHHTPSSEDIRSFNVRGAVAAFKKQKHLQDLGINLRDANANPYVHRSIWEGTPSNP